MTDIVIASAARTPVGAFSGGLSTLAASALGSVAIAEAMKRAGVEPGEVSEVILGQILGAGQGQNPARQASIGADIPVEVPAWGVNQLCGSGLRAVALGYQAILNGDSDIVVAGGQENMSQAPHCVHMRNGTKLGPAELVDTMIKDGLWDAFNGYHMGNTAENVAERWQITREQQDEFAAASQQKAEAAQTAGRFADEIVPVTIKTRKGETVVDTDEHPRHGTTAESLAKLGARAGGVVGRRSRPGRGQRGLRRPGLRGQQGPRLGHRQGQRQRRRHRARPSDRRLGRARADHALVRDGQARRQEGPGDTVHRRRHGHRDVRRPRLTAARSTGEGDMARVALVTGGTRGIGEAISIALKDAGHAVAATYGGNVEAAEAFTAATGIAAYCWDVGDFDACQAGIAQVEADLGPVDVLVNNAGITRDGMLHNSSLENWQAVIRTNLDSVFNMSRGVLEGMRARGFGRIVSISSINGRWARPIIRPPRPA
jgi:hypothetical protein